jgi:hypothetical protein
MACDEDLVNRIRELLAEVDGVHEMRMFGGVSFLIGGHISVAASGHGGLMLHCDHDQTAQLLARPHARPMIMRGREMRGWVYVEPEGLKTKRALKPWVERGVAMARSLPPKGS